MKHTIIYSVYVGTGNYVVKCDFIETLDLMEYIKNHHIDNLEFVFDGWCQHSQ